MEFQKEICSRILSNVEYHAWLGEIIQILDKNQCREVEILFGVAWGNLYKNWTPFKVCIDQIVPEIHSAEHLNTGKFGDDDFYIIIGGLQTEILFCHEMDIHLCYNQENPIIEEIQKRWKTESLIQRTKTG